MTNNNEKDQNRYYSNRRNEMEVFVPKDVKKVLDVGCGEAVFSKRIKDRNKAEVWGIEKNRDAAKKAEKKIDKVIIGDVNDEIKNFPENSFDCVIFNDILEHLINPDMVLWQAKKVVKEDGVVVGSLPNVRYSHVLIELLLKKNWDYKESGVLDKTHLRFFTKKSAKKLFSDQGFMTFILKGINPMKFWRFLPIYIFTFGFFLMPDIFSLLL